MVHIDVWKWISHPPEVYRSMFQLPWISVLKKQSTVTQCHWIIAVHCHVKHVVFKATWGILRYKNGWRLRLKFMHFNVLDLYRLLIIDESGLPWLLNFTPLLRHVEVEHQAHQGTLQHFFCAISIGFICGCHDRGHQKEVIKHACEAFYATTINWQTFEMRLSTM